MLIPWLANGRLPHVDREEVEEHVRSCSVCAEELALQRLICNALAEPDRVTYAPGPSFRKLLDRINSTPARRSPDVTRSSVQSTQKRSGSARKIPFVLRTAAGPAWAASLVLAVGVAGFFLTMHRWSEPRYATHTTTVHGAPSVLHIAFDRSLTIGEVERILHSAGARVVEGPGATGIFGVSPAEVASGELESVGVTQEMQLLSARLRADARVRWVEPVGSPSDQ
jgi:hypothetical protein